MLLFVSHLELTKAVREPTFKALQVNGSYAYSGHWSALARDVSSVALLVLF